MSKKNEIVKAENYQILKVDPKEVSSVLAENMGNDGLTSRDLERIKLPSGGSMFFQYEGLEGTEVLPSIRGVILHTQDARAYWAKGIDEGGGGQPPDCFSDDAIRGEGDPGGACAKCPFSKFKSDKKGRGQACKQIRLIFFMGPEDIMPRILALPPTSLIPFRKYGARLGSRLMRFPQVVTEFGLKEETNDDGIKYASVTVKMAEQLEPEIAAKMVQLSQEMKPIFEANKATAEDFGAKDSGDTEQATEETGGSQVEVDPNETTDSNEEGPEI